MDMFEGDRCYAGLGALPEKPEGAILGGRPVAALKVLEDTAKQGIHQVWIQEGANSPENEAKAQVLGLKGVVGECAFMFFPPINSIHKLHRTINKIFGKLPR